ncbi:MAG: hypothetical protein ACTTJW_06420 [Sphaerochaeta sp.]
MVSYEEAYKITKELKPTINNCTETTNAYVFGCHSDDVYIGGGHSPCVIMKEDGKAVTMPWFVLKYDNEEELRTFEL